MRVSLGTPRTKQERRRIRQRRNERAWRERNPDANRLGARKSRFKKLGITEDDYQRMLSEQGGVCKLCGGEPLGHWSNTGVRSLHVDHCHKTNKVRGLLCLRCNSALGLFKDDPELLKKAIAYLKENS